MANFITEDEWNNYERFNGLEPTLKWRQIEQMKKFCLLSIQELQLPGKSYDTFILHFVDEEEKKYQCYAPSHFIKEIRRRRLPNYRPFFISHGTQERGGKTIAQFEICYKSEDKEWDLFCHEEN